MNFNSLDDIYENAVVYDVEITPNFFGVVAYVYATGEYFDFVEHAEHPGGINEFREFILSHPGIVLVGKNNKYFDNLLTNRILQGGATVERLWNITAAYFEGGGFAFFWSGLAENKIFTELLITDEMKKVVKQLTWMDRPYFSVDMQPLCTSNMTIPSLKMIGIHLHADKIQDIPFTPGGSVSIEEISEFMLYCRNDVDITTKIFDSRRDHLQARWDTAMERNADLEKMLSSSDSGMGNILLEQELGKENLWKTTEYDQIVGAECFPDCIVFETEKMQEYFHSWKTKVFSDRNNWKHSDLVELHGTTYKNGIGGLHSVDAPGSFENVLDCDISSMYPFSMLLFGFFPKHLMHILPDKFRGWVNTRMMHKKAGNKKKAYILKIMINAIFGKLKTKMMGDMLAFLSVTLTGQFMLLMLIERLGLAGIEVISANTDGVTAIVPPNQRALYIGICEQWCNDTGYQLEYMEHRIYKRKDVNNYLAETVEIDEPYTYIKEMDGIDKPLRQEGAYVMYKEKGAAFDLNGGFDAYGKKNLTKGYNAPIIAHAVQQYVYHGITPEDTVLNETNPHYFFFSQRVGKPKNCDVHFKQFLQKPTRVSFGNVNFDEVELQKTNRYAIYDRNHFNQLGFEHGTYLKRHPVTGKDTRINAKEEVVICNNLPRNPVVDDIPIKKEYYIKEAWDLIIKIEGGNKYGQRSMF